MKPTIAITPGRAVTIKFRPADLESTSKLDAARPVRTTAPSSVFGLTIRPAATAKFVAPD